MAIEKTIKINVDVDSADTNLKKLESSLDSVSKVGKKTNLSSNFDSSSEAIQVLDSKTKGLASGFIEVGKAAKVGGKAMKSALISSGIGILLVIVSEIVANWDSIVEFISDSNEGLQDQIDLGNEIVSDLEFQLDILKIQQKTLENQGKSTKEIKQTIKETLKTQLLQEETLLNQEISQGQIEESKAVELTLWQKIQLASGGVLGNVQLISEEEKQQQKDRKDALEDRKKGIETLKLRLSELDKEEKDEDTRNYKEALKRKNEDYKQFLKENKEAERRVREEEQFEEDEREYDNETARLLEEQEQAEIEDEERRIARLEKTLEKERKQKEDAANFEKKLAENVQNAKFNIASNTAGLISQIVEKDSALGKGVALAQATISGIQGVQNAYTTAQASPITIGFPAYPAIQAGLAGAFSALQIKNILKTNPKTGKGKGSNSSSSGGGGGQSAPSFNLVQGTGSNQIAESLANQDRPLKAYVTSGDVSTSQSLDRNIIENRSL